MTEAAEQIGEEYQRHLSRTYRRLVGAHYTPRDLTEPLVRQALTPLVARRSVLRIRVCDPACGCGAFLLQACRFLADHLVKTTAIPRVEALRLVAERCLFGVDHDPHAVELAKESLRRLTQSRESFHGTVQHGEALLDFNWGNRFDSVLTNPPFINSIDGNTPETVKSLLRGRYPVLHGTADLAYYFVALAHQLAHAEGTVGIVLPRPFLNAPSAKRLRQELLERRPPSRICLPDGNAFDLANVRVAAVVLGGGPAVVSGDNWWAADALSAASSKKPETLGERFEVMASMTAAMAYELLPFLVDSANSDWPRLITTGLIDPNHCRWGSATCRYLRRDFAYPRIALDSTMPKALRSRISKTGRPKVLVAGVAGPGVRIEAYFDRIGDSRGAVSTFTLLDREDDSVRLERVCEYLNGDLVACKVEEQLGASAMGSGLITITKDFLRRLPIDNA